MISIKQTDEKKEAKMETQEPREEQTHCNAGAARAVSNLLKTTRCQDQGEWSKRGTERVREGEEAARGG